MKNTFLIILLAAGLVVACKKKKDDPIPKKSNYEYLTQDAWYIAEQYVGPGDETVKQGWRDLKKTGHECYYDDTITFATNGIIYSDEGPTRCYSYNPQVDSSQTWFFSKSIYGIDSNYIKINDGVFTISNHIIRLDDEVLELSGPAAYSDSTLHTIYKHH